MGLSASQARLLSITSRLNNNELQSEFISNSKIQLANKNMKATDKYINALDSTKIDYVSYDDTGIQETVALTFNSMSQYTPLKNQYNLYNTEGQILVSPQDAANFKNANTLYEFLDCYGLFDRGAGEYQKALADYNNQMTDYNDKMDAYNLELAKFNQEFGDYQTKLDDYNKKLADYLKEEEEYNKKLKEYEDALNAPKLYTPFITAATTGSEAFHYAAAKGGDSGCLLHVLNNLLKDTAGVANPPYTTSAGSQITSLWQDTYYHIPDLYTVGTTMAAQQDTYVCDGKDVGTDGTENLYEKARKNGEPITDLIKLASDFKEIDNGGENYSYEKKSLYQKTIDMYYLILNSKEMRSGAGSLNLWSLSDVGASVGTVVENFVEGDMKGLDPEEPTPPEPLEPFEEEMPKLNISPPILPEKPLYIQKIYDQPLAQWYINLWNAMEGSDKSDKLRSIGDEEANFSYYTTPDKARKSTFDKYGNQVNEYYQIIDKNLASDSNWLQFALTNGIVTMKQAALRFNGDITWEGIEFSSTSDIREVQDSTKIAQAEAEYKKSMYEIQAQDKEFDQDLRKLDTEHSAMKQEIDSIKNVMSKNVEKSFTVFS